MAQRQVFDRFTVNFAIDCAADAITFAQDFQSVDYYIPEEGETGLPLSLMPIYMQKFPSCEVQCDLVSPTFGYTQPPFLSLIDKISG